MRIFIIFLNKEQIGTMFCDEKCDVCRHRFLCFTTAFPATLIINHPNAYELSLQYGRTFMRCPHCQELFKVTYDQLQNNTKFRCKVCGRYNWGSCEADEYGILVGQLNV